MTAFLAVLVPAADAVLGHLRDRWDPASRRGLGAHVTIRYPFLSLEQLGPGDVHQLATAVASVPAFSFTLARVSRFPTTVFLQPEPVGPFAALRCAVDRVFGARLPVDRFPRYLPHLSVARNVRPDAGDVLDQLHTALAGEPIEARCTEVVLLERRGGPWAARGRFSLRSTSTTHLVE